MNDHYAAVAVRVLIPPNEPRNKKLNPKLDSYLNDINTMCRNAGGQLISRQAIAVAIQNWKQQNQLEPALID